MSFDPTSLGQLAILGAGLCYGISGAYGRARLKGIRPEASAAAMLGASIHYPLRGAVTWKSIVGTNVAADALSNLSSPGVTGGVLIVVGEDYGEGARHQPHHRARRRSDVHRSLNQTSCLRLMGKRNQLPIQ